MRRGPKTMGSLGDLMKQKASGGKKRRRRRRVASAPSPYPFLAFFFRRKVLRQKQPLLASFKLTYRCNLACQACPSISAPEAGIA